MFKSQIKSRALFIFLIAFFIWFFNQVLCFDLTEEISSVFQKLYDEGYKDDYFNNSYSSSYSKDPYRDSLKNLWSMTNQLKVSWVQYVEDALWKYNCSLSQDKIWAILYYYVPEFRNELSRSLKLESWNMDGKDFVYDKSVIEKYCYEYSLCFENKGKDSKQITESLAKDSMTSCREFFQKYYDEWKESEQRVQNMQKSQMWVDKFWNSTEDDSAYDIMLDLWTVWKLLYEEVVLPITPVFYNLPLFSNSKNSLRNTSGKDTPNSSSSRWNVWWGWTNRWNNRIVLWSDLTEDDWAVLRWDLWNTKWNLSLTSNNKISPLTTVLSNKVDYEREYDKLVEWLWGYSILNNWSMQYWSLCRDDSVSSEPESPEVVENLQDSNTTVWRDLSKLSDDEYEEVIDYMLDAVDKYATLPEDKEEEIRRIAWDVSGYNSAVTESELEEVANEIKNCRKSCDWLRIDQKASCMLMCACWEIKSPIFNPEKTPWLWPIFMIRFCTIPAVDSRFSVWWRKMFSIEEWMNEIYGVNDKLSREWKLWIWTQQHNFLDSTTKDIKIKDMISFTINVEWENVANKLSKHSKQYSDKVIKSDNKILQYEYNISNPLDNNVLKNHYRLVGFEWEDLDDLRANANWNDVKERLSDLAVIPELATDQSKDSHASRYGEITELLNNWLDQEWDFWVSTLWYITDMDSYAKALYAKK